MSSDSERLLPPENPAVFESLCLDLWQEIWGDPGARKNGRSGQAQAGVDVFGVHDGRQVGVQCKQKDGLLRTRVTVKELETEVANALGFRPALDTFILATSGPADAPDGRFADRPEPPTATAKAREKSDLAPTPTASGTPRPPTRTAARARTWGPRGAGDPNPRR